MENSQITQFAPVIRTLTSSELQNGHALNPKFRLAQEGNIEVCYAPFEFINPLARVVIVGITPGRTQMVNALVECQRQLNSGASNKVALKAAKETGAFSGTMRPNLIAMLDAVGLNHWLGLKSCSDLFGHASHLIQTTSVLRNPVFINGENYNGTPNMIRHGLLRQQLIDGFGNEAQALPNAVFVPLGDKVAEALDFLVDRSYLRADQILRGLPHPSGANAERIAYFLGKKNRDSLSIKTDPEKLDLARTAILEQVAALV